ncbi:uncharacterized protein [Eucyclogobius newberryi]|uniref:uncharacterized protein isoform X2 n=1 Tax=Eucyclogobius newberryi TaxID=166745 RepID=UPI003B5BF4F6
MQRFLIIATESERKTVTCDTMEIWLLLTAPKKPAFVWIDWWMWIAAGVSGLVLIILVIVCLLLRRRQRRQRDSEDPVYANTHHSSKQPSPRPSPTDNSLKMDSSYQNLRTPDVGKRYEPSRRI